MKKSQYNKLLKNSTSNICKGVSMLLNRLLLIFIMLFLSHYTIAVNNTNYVEVLQTDTTFNLCNEYDKQFPLDNYIYRPNYGPDNGFDQYRARTLYNSSKIALTFDDGPHPTRTNQLLDILDQYNVKATFFVLTRKINKNSEPIIRRILNEGHLLASHDLDHDNNNEESLTEFKRELSMSITTLENIEDKLGILQNEMYYRFPYGAYGKNSSYHHLNAMKDVSNALYGENCINFVFWDIDTADWVSNMTPENISNNIWAHLKGGTAFRHKLIYINGKKKYIKDPYTISRPIGGGIILMHDIHQRSIDAINIFLESIQNSNIEIVPLNEVLEYQYSHQKCILI